VSLFASLVLLVQKKDGT
jgi:hypothetical protein